MQLSEDSALKVAEFLLQIKAVVLRPNEPFTWASGWKSPIYCDNRKSLSYPKIRNYIRQELVKTVDHHFGKPDVIAGVATGGIAQGVLVAQELGLPFIYVRPEAKSHGLGNRIEGVAEAGQSVIVVEDLISTGKSSLKAVDALREAGCTVKGLVAIFSYGFDESEENMRQAHCPYYTLTNYELLLKQAEAAGYINERDIQALEAWRQSPSTWLPQTSAS